MKMNNNLRKKSNKRGSVAMLTQVGAVSQAAAMNKLRSLQAPYAPLDYERTKLHRAKGPSIT
jgi:hypothetical protein